MRIKIPAWHRRFFERNFVFLQSVIKTLDTMDLYSQIEADIKAAMLARDHTRLQALRGIKKRIYRRQDSARRKR